MTSGPKATTEPTRAGRQARVTAPLRSIITQAADYIAQFVCAAPAPRSHGRQPLTATLILKSLILYL